MFLKHPTKGAPEAARRPPSRLKAALNRTKVWFTEFLSPLTGVDLEITDDFYRNLAETLVLADVGINLATEIVFDLRKLNLDRGHSRSRDALADLRSLLIFTLAEGSETLAENQERETFAEYTKRPLILMMVGVNGSGKTTACAKLADYYAKRGSSVLLAGADTFRAAAREQIKIWADRLHVPLVSGEIGADPSSVIFDAIKASSARQIDIVIVDTAGRLQTKANLMRELEKMRRTIDKALPGGEVVTLLTVNATQGQNVLSQVEHFSECTPLTGAVLNMLDSSAKGGVIISMARKYHLPVLFVGTGEGIEDLAEFDPAAYVDALLEEPAEGAPLL